MKILLHACCAPCSIYPLESLLADGFTPTAYFFNPNIHPYQEFKRRMTTMREYASTCSLPLVEDNTYGLLEFIRKVAFHEASRCTLCYTMRLEKVAQTAKELDFPSFSTTLLYSRYQNHSIIRSIAEDISQRTGITFVYRDFRQGWQYGVDCAIQQQLYRQPYCGCVYSEQERYDKSLTKDRNHNNPRSSNYAADAGDSHKK